MLLVVQALMIHALWGRRLKSTAEARARVMDMIPREAIMDPLLLKQSLVVLGGGDGRLRVRAPLAS